MLGAELRRRAARHVLRAELLRLELRVETAQRREHAARHDLKLAVEQMDKYLDERRPNLSFLDVMVRGDTVTDAVIPHHVVTIGLGMPQYRLALAQPTHRLEAARAAREAAATWSQELQHRIMDAFEESECLVG